MMGQQADHKAEDSRNPMSGQSDELLTIDEVAAYLKAGKRTVYRLAAAGTIPAFKLGGTWRFRRAELDQWIASRIGKGAGGDEPGSEE
jgi:excisionase family DNA binding protein